MDRHRTSSWIVLVGSLATWTGCGDSAAPPTTGYLEITATGLPLQYGAEVLSITVGSETLQFSPYFPTLTLRLVLADLEPGDYALTLDGMPSGVPAVCRATDGSERTVSVAAGGRHFVRFDLDCTGAKLRIETSTMGVDLDPDGYHVEVCYSSYPYYDYGNYCETVVIPVPVNGTVVGSLGADLIVGGYVASLTDVATNCVTPEPQAFDYPRESTVSFTVTCAAASSRAAGAAAVVRHRER